MTLLYTEITGTFKDGSGKVLNGSCTFAPSATVYDATGLLLTSDLPIPAAIVAGNLQALDGTPLTLLATDNAGLRVDGLTGFWHWTVDVTVSGDVTPDAWSFFLPGDPTTVDLYALANTTAGGGGGGGAVASVDGRTGAVTLSDRYPLRANNLSDLANAGTARTNLGLGTAATHAATDFDVRPAWQFPVEAYGAVGDGTTDDTTAINNAVADAVAYAVANRHYAEVTFKAAVYKLAGSLTQGGATKGNALIPLPVIATTAHKVTLAFKGAGEASALPHWEQTTAQKTGTVLLTAVAGTNDATFGAASVIGGPTPQQGYGYHNDDRLFSNMLVVIDGISVSLPSDPNICGFDLRGVAECVLPSLSAFAAGSPGGGWVVPTTSWQFGLAMPESGNNALCDIGRYSAEGMCIGVKLSEHTVAQSLRAFYCVVGLAVVSCAPYHAHVFYATVGQVQEAVQIQTGGSFSPSDQGSCFIDIDVLDYERETVGGFAEFKFWADTNDLGRGQVGVNSNGAAFQAISPVVESSGVKIEDLRQLYGAATAPSVPATTVALRNPFWRDAAVVVAGGTVTAIAVDGVAQGVTSGMVIVPSGKTVTLTYSSAPSWKWTLL